MNAGMIGALVAAVILPTLLGLLLRFFSQQQTNSSTCEVPEAELYKRYLAWELWGLIPVVMLIALMVGCWFAVFELLQLLVESLLPASQFCILPPWIYWLLLAGLPGIVSAMLPIHYLYLYLLGEQRYCEFTHYGNLRARRDNWRQLRRMAVGMAAALLLIVPPSLECYTLFTADALIENPFFSIGETRHSYDDIVELRTIARLQAPNGQIVDKPYYQIVFKDGFIWRSTRIMAEPLPETAHEIMEFVSQQTGLPLKAFNLAPE